METEFKNVLSSVYRNFIEVLSNIKRPGILELLNQLSTWGFYKSPASTKFHLCFSGGLLVHSWRVYQNLLLLSQMAPKVDEPESQQESFAIMALLHDVCKCLFYEVGDKWSKDSGKWEKVPMWNVNDQVPLGHGEKSIFMVGRYISLTVEEALAIRFHLGHTDPGTHFYYPTGAAQDKAREMYPSVMLLHLADMMTAMYEKCMSFHYDGKWIDVPERYKFVLPRA